MKKTFTKQILLLLVFITTNISVKAQFMCTDINPDSVITKSTAGTYTWNIDINNDNTPDFQYSLVLSGPNFGFLNFQSGVASMSQNYVLTTSSGSIAVLNAGAPVAATSTSWHPMNASNPNFFLMAAGPPQGLWAGQTDKYVGVAVAVSTNTFFGWIKMSTSGTIASYTVKEYGFNSVAGASIAAGQACAPASTYAATFNLQDTICQNKTVNVLANTGTVAANGFTWSAAPSGPTISAPNSLTTNITFPTTGIFTISLATTSGTMTGSSSQTIFVAPNPAVSVSSSSNNICVGSSAVLTASGSGTFYMWNTSATGPTISVSPTVNTTYTVTAYLGSCTSTAVFTQSVHVCTGLTSFNEMEYGFDLFPNPATDKLNIRSLNSGQKEITVIITDLLGKRLAAQKLSFADQFDIQTLNMTELSKGVYFITLKGESGHSTVTRIVKE
jgi:hypothetical protein